MTKSTTLSKLRIDGGSTLLTRLCVSRCTFGIMWSSLVCTLELYFVFKAACWTYDTILLCVFEATVANAERAARVVKPKNEVQLFTHTKKINQHALFSLFFINRGLICGSVPGLLFAGDHSK